MQLGQTRPGEAHDAAPGEEAPFGRILCRIPTDPEREQNRLVGPEAARRPRMVCNFVPEQLSRKEPSLEGIGDKEIRFHRILRGNRDSMPSPVQQMVWKALRRSIGEKVNLFPSIRLDKRNPTPCLLSNAQAKLKLRLTLRPNSSCLRRWLGTMSTMSTSNTCSVIRREVSTMVSTMVSTTVSTAVSTMSSRNTCSVTQREVGKLQVQPLLYITLVNATKDQDPKIKDQG